MRNSMIVFLINDSVRGVMGQYEEGGKKELFKTLDPDLAVDDFAVVESTTRHGMTVVKICEVDVDVDIEDAIDPKWVVQRIDSESFASIIEQEKAAITAVQTAERKRKREELKAQMFKDHEESLKTLAIASSGQPVVEE